MAVLTEERIRSGHAMGNSPLHAHARPNPLRSAPQVSLLCSGSRRWFLKTGIASLGGLALWIMDRIARRASLIPESAETSLTVPWSAAWGVRFYDSLIVVNHPDAVAVFSSKCPHMGCRINRTEGSELVCPCHGSRFDLKGNVMRGPATHGLQPLPFTLDPARGQLRVTLGSSQT